MVKSWSQLGGNGTQLPPFVHPISPPTLQTNYFSLLLGIQKGLAWQVGTEGRGWPHDRRWKKGLLLARATHSFICLSLRSLCFLPTHLACYLIRRKNATHQLCSHHWWTAFVFLILWKNKSIVGRRQHFTIWSFTCYFSTTDIYWGLLGSALGTQTWKRHSDYFSVQATHRSTIIMVSALRGRAFRVHWEPLRWLCGIREVFSVEETSSQVENDELKFVRLINVLIWEKASQVNGIAWGYRSAFFELQEIENVSTDSGF